MLLLQCSIIVQLVVTATASYYHELSMVTFQPPTPLSNDSYFGYSIAYNHQDKSIVTSAPRADANGQVFSCEIATKRCTQLDIMSPDDIKRVGMESYKHYDHQFWLGATVKADSKNLVVCAPRDYMKTSIFNFYGTYGRCYVKDLTSSNSTFQALALIKTRERTALSFNNEQATDSFGWSMDIATDHSIRVGGPAMAAGQMITYQNPKPNIAPRVLKGSSLAENVKSNFGYSIATGNFFNYFAQHFAVGTPYGDHGVGKVIFFTMQYDTYSWTINDHNVGSLFGASLCSAKLTANKTSLLIGAPAFFENWHRYHTGRVYLYVPSSSQRQMDLKKYIEGPKDGGFFGYSIANAGDMDSDDQDEIVIAAPYEDDGRGAVYLYSGSMLIGASDKVSWIQRFQPKGFTSFGISLSAMNYANNGCNDLAIGAPESDRVALYHCLPTITVHIKADHQIQKRVDKTSFIYKSCFSVSPNRTNDIKADFKVTVRLTHPNATFADKSQNTEYVQRLQRSDEYLCHPIKVLTPENGDYEQNIQFDITAVLLNDPAESKEFHPSMVTLSKRSSLSLTDSVRAADCMKEHCEPELSLLVTTTIVHPYKIGSTDSEFLNVSILNGAGETAYRPCARVSMDGGATLVRAPPSCVFVDETTRVCQLQGPLVNQSSWHISKTTPFEIDMTSLTSVSDSMQVIVEVFNRCNMSGSAANVSKIPIELKKDISGVEIDGKTDEGDDDNTVIATRAEIRKFGKKLHHTYTITNNHGTNWIDPVCSIWIKQEPYLTIEYPIQVYRGDSGGFPCQPEKIPSKEGYVKLQCLIGNLFKKDTIIIIVPIYSQPGKLGDILEKANATVQTKIILHFDDEPQDVEKSVTTVLTLRETAVPLWIILAAAVVGLLIVVLIAFVLHECGFLRRKNKEKLEDLKTEVNRKSRLLHRQSMRMSQRDRATLRNRTYRELLDEAEILEIEEAKEARESQDIRDSLVPNIEQPIDDDIKKQIELSLQRQAVSRKVRYTPTDREI